MIIFYSNFHNAYETIVLRKTENDEFKSFQELYRLVLLSLLIFILFCFLFDDSLKILEELRLKKSNLPARKVKFYKWLAWFAGVIYVLSWDKVFFFHPTLLVPEIEKLRIKAINRFINTVIEN